MPRIVLDGFVIAPASWRLPPALRQGGAGGRAERSAAGGARPACRGSSRSAKATSSTPSISQAPGAAAELAEYERVFEIWPPLDVGRRSRRAPRRGRRRRRRRRAPPRPAHAAPGRVPPPRQAPPLAGWRTFKLFGAAARQDALLIGTVLPAVDRRARRRGDRRLVLPALPRRPRRAAAPPPSRPRRRRRAGGVRAPVAARARAGARRRRAAPRSRPATTFPSAAGSSPAIWQPFTRSSSPTARPWPRCSPIRSSTVSPALPLLFDALARGLGLDLAARHALARERRQAAEAWTRLDAEARKESDADFRHHARALRAALGAAPAAPRAPRGARRRGGRAL